MHLHRHAKTVSLRSKWSLLLLASLPVFLLNPKAAAQVDRAVLEGTISDPSGRVIAAATVNAVAVDTGLTEQQKTNANGYYRFPGLASGAYTVTATAEGFKTQIVGAVSLFVGQTHTLDVQLAVGTVAEKVEVTASLGP